MTKILGISGKKQSGKTTAGNFLFGCSMLSCDLVEYARINKNGSLVVPYQSSNGETKPCVFPTNSFHPNMVSYMSANIWSKIKIYNFADSLKRLCIEILGLTERQCYGNEEEKNSFTQFKWPEMNVDYQEKQKDERMTSREVMQYIGTDVFRKMYSNVWVDSTIRKIKSESPELSVVVDCRFPNEIEGIQNAGGKVIRLTRNIFGQQDQHPSETALDKYDKFDYTINNQSMTVSEQNEALYNQLIDWELIDYQSVPTSE